MHALYNSRTSHYYMHSLRTMLSPLFPLPSSFPLTMKISTTATSSSSSTTITTTTTTDPPTPYLRFPKHGLHSPHRRRRLRAPLLQRPPPRRCRRRRSCTARCHRRALIAAAAAAAVKRRADGGRRQPPPGPVGAGRGSGDGQEKGVIALGAKRGRASRPPAVWYDERTPRVWVGGFGNG